MKKILKIEGLDCPVCAEALQSDLQKIKGVQSVCVDYVSQTITLETENEETIAKVIKKANAFEEVRVLDGEQYAPKKKFILKDWIPVGIAVLFLVGGILLEHFAVGTLGMLVQLRLN